MSGKNCAKFSLKKKNVLSRILDKRNDYYCKHLEKRAKIRVYEIAQFLFLSLLDDVDAAAVPPTVMRRCSFSSIDS